MYFLLFLFFGSLLGIAFMIGRKLVFQTSNEETKEELLLEIPYLDEWKDLGEKSAKKIVYNIIVSGIRIHVKSVNFIKERYNELKRVIAERQKTKKGETSKFLKTVSEYKRKIREIKHKIAEEEKNLKI